jgi:hypothetical protein
LLVLPFVLLRRVGFIDTIIEALPEKLVFALIGLAGILSVSVGVLMNYKRAGWVSGDVEIYRVVGDWAKEATPPEAVFLLSVGEKKAISETQFQYAAQRRVWVSFKQGAAVMWYPAYHQEWSQRTREVAALRSLPEKFAYAKENEIDYVLAFCDASIPSEFEYKGFCAYKVAP